MKEIKTRSNDNSTHNEKIIIPIGIFIILILCTITCYLIKIKIETKNKIYYQERGNLDYKIFLNENSFYDKPYLEKNKVYIASLIDKIDITFDYDFKATDQININFNYDIIGKIVIKDESDQNTYFEKEYYLLKDQVFRLANTDYYKLKETISIDYNHYDELAKSFSSTYGVNTNSSLQVFLRLKKTSENINLLKVNPEDIIQMTIPLSKKSVEIKVNDREINNEHQFIEKSDIRLIIKIIYILIALFALSAVITLIKIIHTLSKSNNTKSKYDKYIQKLLVEYDRVIAETTTFPNILEHNLIQLTKFEELLDVRDNLKLPIMYYCIEEHQKAHFYIKSSKDLYLVTIENNDLNK